MVRPPFVQEREEKSQARKRSRTSAKPNGAEHATKRTERAFLAAADITQGEQLWSVDDSLQELKHLAETAGAEVVGQLVQRLHAPDVATYLGRGRTAELAQLRIELDYDVLIFDEELSPSQQRNLERVVDTRIIDRTALILDIFAQRARTREGILQVELAQLEYLLPRLARTGATLSRLGGGIGTRGPGETKLESDRRRIRSRISDLRHQLEAVRQQRALHREQRAEQLIPVVAIVGYTNAGKSTVFNYLTNAGVRAENKVFATLDPTTRHISLPSHQEILLTDTVGFIQKLPTSLVAAFRATLEEVTDADILLEVLDISHENAFEQHQTVEEIINELGAGNKPRLTALNKVDLLPDPEDADRSLYPNSVRLSARTGYGFPDLLAEIGRIISAEMPEINVHIPYSKSELVELFHRRGRIRLIEHDEKGTTIRGRVPPALQAMFAAFELRGSSLPAPPGQREQDR